jgi:hypothetical protein
MLLSKISLRKKILPLKKLPLPKKILQKILKKISLRKKIILLKMMLNKGAMVLMALKNVC